VNVKLTIAISILVLPLNIVTVLSEANSRDGCGGRNSKDDSFKHNVFDGPVK
jgi:hypothetical protein